jgi:hypothetical protein
VSGLVQKQILVPNGDHLHIQVISKERPGLSIDVFDSHGRRALAVSVNGVTIGSMLVDVAPLDAREGKYQRFCPFCGVEIPIWSSAAHVCEE